MLVAVASVPLFPTAANTGVPPGTSLRTVGVDVSSGPGWSFSSGQVTVTGDNAVLDALYCPYNITTRANNVTISRSLIVTDVSGPGNASQGCITPQHTFSGGVTTTYTGLTITDCEIRGTNGTTAVAFTGLHDLNGDTAGIVITRCNIYWATTCLQMVGGTVQDSFIHSVYRPAGTTYHLNCFTSGGYKQWTSGPSPQLNLVNSTWLNPQTQTDAISLFCDNGPNQNRLISGNLLGGGGYPFYGGIEGLLKGSVPQPSSIVFTNNRFTTAYWPLSGQFGPVLDWYNDNGASNIWANNVYHETGEPIPEPPPYAPKGATVIRGGGARFPSGHN